MEKYKTTRKRRIIKSKRLAIKKKRNTIHRKHKIKSQKGGAVIKKIVHQIWFGSSVPQWRKYLFDNNASICKQHGYEYKLWTEDMRTHKFFESTYGYQQDALTIGKENGQSRWAQVADLARLEIIYKLGGVYLDSLFEISNQFLNEITRVSDSNGYLFIGANEDPCRLNCKGANNKKYLTNSFFAAPQWSVILERLLDEKRLDDIDLKSVYINRTTGPYYLRSGISDKEIDDEVIFLFNTEQIYPFNVNESAYRKIHPNICLKPTSEVDKNADYIKVNDKQSLRKNCLDSMDKASKPLTIYHSGLGGTWTF
jgi:hypothetical protein